MANPLFSALGGAPNLMQMVQQLKSNPAQVLAKKFNIPTNIQTNPQAMLQHLVSSGQVTQEQINQAYATAQRMGFKG